NTTHADRAAADAPLVGAGGAVQLLVELDAEETETAADAGAHRRGVLADAGGEGQRVDAAEDRGVGADVLRDPVREQLEREFGADVAAGGGVLQLAHVAAAAGDAEQSAPMIEQIVELRLALPLAQQ